MTVFRDITFLVASPQVNASLGAYYMHAILQGDPEAITRHIPIVGLPAIIACFVSGNFGGALLLTCVHTFIFAVSAACMTKYKTDKGLWMLALFFAVFWAGFLAMGTFAQFLDWWRGAPFEIGLAIDVFFTMFLMRLMVRFLWKTAKLNYKMSVGGG